MTVGSNRVDRSGAEPDEIRLKAPFWTSATVNARLAETFSETDFGAAALLISLLAPDPACPVEADETACRLMLAATRVSEGSLARLQMWVAVARNDPRDLIGAAEYANELGAGTPQAREADLAEYLAWVRGTAGASGC